MSGNVWEKLANAKVQVWFCPEGHTGTVFGPTVEWRGDTAYCLYPGCGQNSSTPVHVLATEYQVTALPIDHNEAHWWSVWVQWRNRVDGVDLYAVCDASNGSQRNYHFGCHEWVWEPRPSERTEDYTASTRFPLGDALVIAKRLCQEIRINGMTAHDIIKREGLRQ